MIRTYARRLLSPFVGLVQVAETNNARALSLDGRNWAIQYALAEAAQTRDRQPRVDPDLHFSLGEDWENLRQHKEGEETRYLWEVSRQSRGKLKHCWMTDAIISAENRTPRQLVKRAGMRYISNVYGINGTWASGRHPFGIRRDGQPAPKLPSPSDKAAAEATPTDSRSRHDSIPS